jgi:hypothetical protein
MKHLLSDKFTIGGDASAAAGPVGREATAQTDAMMNAEMLSYSRSRGLFAGISLEGATLRPDVDTDRELYARDATNREILTGDFKTPAVAGKFERALKSGLGPTQQPIACGFREAIEESCEGLKRSPPRNMPNCVRRVVAQFGHTG